MKTAISVPNNLFEAAEQVARRLGLTRSKLYTLALADAPGNVLIKAKGTGLPKDSVASVSQIVTIDKEFLVEQSGKLSALQMQQVDDGLRLVLSL
ncbi:MAG: type II toxin-antitoxin system PemK/MazF family toxin [bacterium]